MNTGERIKLFREKANLSQLELANRLGMSQSALSHYETGRRQDREIIEKIAKELGITLNQLIPEIESEKLSDDIVIQRNLTPRRNEGDIILEFRDFICTIDIKSKFKKAISDDHRNVIRLHHNLGFALEKAIYDLLVENKSKLLSKLSENIRDQRQRIAKQLSLFDIVVKEIDEIKNNDED